jgi:hypothetical protein
MKCPECDYENKDDAKECKKCNAVLQENKIWTPSWKWHVKVLVIIYVCLTIAFFALKYFVNKLPEPYKAHDIPEEMTPWLKGK